MKKLGILILFALGACHDTSNRVQPDTSSFEDRVMEFKQAELDKAVNETSGLVKIGDHFWTQNDSGGDPAVYKINVASGSILRRVNITGAKNVDWESLTTDSKHLYIGNFGNNLGGRKDLGIYKVRLDSLETADNVEAELISFSYPDQDEYYSSYDHNHDCEAMISYGDSLYLFSKNWQNMRCKVFSLPKTAGTHKAVLMSEFDSKGTITGATISMEDESLYLLGYNPGKGFDPFLWKISNWSDSNFLDGDKQRWNLTPRRQVEGIALLNDTQLLISSEEEDGGYPSLFTYPR